MSAETPREFLERNLKALLPQGWVYTDGALPDVVKKPTVTQLLRGAVFTPEAPIAGSLDADFVVIVMAPNVLDMGPLEDALLDLLFALRKVPNVRVTRADRSEYGFEISITLTISN